MYGVNQFDQDDLILQLKNMPKPPISKELAKEIGFDPKKYEGVINNLLCQIHEVRKERLKEKYLFDEKLKSLQYNGPSKAKMNNIKNKLKKNNTKISLNRPKSNYKSIKSSGYGITPKKINIFSTRPRKKTKDIKNSIPVGQKAVNKKSKNILSNNKSTNSLNKVNNNIGNFYTFKNVEINSKNNSKVIKGENKDINNLNSNNFNKPKNNLNNINKGIDYNNNPPLTYYDEIMKEIEKMQNQNRLIEERYQNICDDAPQNKIINNEKANISQDKDKIMNIFLKGNNQSNHSNQSNQSKYKIYEDIIKSNVELISKDIIEDLLYELILDLKKIEDKRAEKQKIENENKIKKILNLNEDEKKLKNKFEVKNKSKNQINFIAEPKKEFINKCNKYKNDFKNYMILKGSFLTNDIFKIYDDFVEEMSKSVIEQGLNFYIKQMENFIKKIENKK